MKFAKVTGGRTGAETDNYNQNGGKGGMDKFIVNIIHRPEMVPEYAEKVTGHGKEEDIGRKELLTESLIFSKHSRQLRIKTD